MGGPPELIFGCASLGESFTQPADIEKLADVLSDIHVSRVDTAARYPSKSPGLSEKLMGEARYGERFTIDTKIAISGRSGDGSLTAPKIEESIVQSLKSLNVSKVNVLYCHTSDNTTPLVEQAEAFHEQYKKGRFTYLGVSNFTLAMVEQWLKISEEKGWIKPSFFQGQYNLICRNYESALLPFLRKHGIHLVAYSPLAGGFLTGKLTPTTETSTLKGTRFEENNPMGAFYRHWYDKPGMHKAIERLRETCAKHELSMAEASLRWLRYHSALAQGDAIISGASRISQAEEAGRMLAKGPLPDGLAADLQGVWELCEADAASILQQ